jgi:hypothetical protein
LSQKEAYGSHAELQPGPGYGRKKPGRRVPNSHYIRAPEPTVPIRRESANVYDQNSAFHIYHNRGSGPVKTYNQNIQTRNNDVQQCYYSMDK